MPLTVRAATEADIPRIVEVSMAAFDPATDVMSRRLIPNCKGENNSFSEEFRNWSVMRKSARLVAPRSIMLVAVDDEPAGGATAPAPGRIVGYAVWFRPLAEGEEEEAPTKPKPPVAGLDMEAVATLRGAIMKDEYDSFGDKGAADVWSKYYLLHFYSVTICIRVANCLLQHWTRLVLTQNSTGEVSERCFSNGAWTRHRSKAGIVIWYRHPQVCHYICLLVLRDRGMS